MGSGFESLGGHRFSSRVSLRILSRISLRSNVIPKALTRISVAFHSPSPAPVPFVVECPHAISGLEDRSHWPLGNPSARKIRRTMTRRIRQPQWSAWTDAACARFRNGRGLALATCEMGHIPRFGIDWNHSNKRSYLTSIWGIPHYMQW